MTGIRPATAGRPPRRRTGTGTGAAHQLLPLAEQILGARLPLRLRAWDGSTAGPEGAPVVVLRSRRALRRLVWQPDELGLAQAYITGDLDIDGDLTDGLRTVWGAARERGPRPPELTLADRARAVGTMLRLGAIGPRPPVPSSQARLGGALHSKARDRAAISHHYDLSNDFYALLLDETMAYSCGYWTTGRARLRARAARPATAPPTPSATSWSWSAASWASDPVRRCWTSAAAGDRSPCTPPRRTGRGSPP